MSTFSPSRRADARPFARIACTAGLTAVLACAGALGPWTQAAYAASEETTAELEQLGAQVREAAAAHDAAIAAASDLDSQISAQAAEILRIEQEVLPAQRQRAAQAAAHLYKMRESSGNIVSMLFSTNSLTDFITSMKYLTTIQDDNVEILQDLEETSAELSARMAELSSMKDEAVAQEQTASAALSQVSAAQQAMQERADSEDAAEAEAARRAAEDAAELQRQMEERQAAEQAAAAEAQQQQAQQEQAQQDEQAAEQPQAPDQNTAAETPSQSEQDATSGSDDAADQESTDTSDSSGWMTGVASHYGTGDGLMGGTTASGDIVTETSMGVAMLNVPLGTYVEIRYGGKSVIAVVNDRGPYAHGRVIDMQPAVARALGFLSVGVGTVEYRFL